MWIAFQENLNKLYNGYFTDILKCSDYREASQHYKKFTLRNIRVIKYSFTLKDNVKNRGWSKLAYNVRKVQMRLIIQTTTWPKWWRPYWFANKLFSVLL